MLWSFYILWPRDPEFISNEMITFTSSNSMQLDTTLILKLDDMMHTGKPLLTHWGRVTHVCVGNLTTIGSDNGLSPGRRQAIIWTNAEILLIGPLGTNFSDFLIEILTFSFKKMCLKVSSAKWRPFCLGLNVLRFLITAHFAFFSLD